MCHLESPAFEKEEHLCSLLSEELKKGCANFSDRLKHDDLPETFKSDDVSKLEKMEENLKKKKEILSSRIDEKTRRFWIVKLCMFLFMVIVISAIAGTIIYPPNQEDGPGPFPKIASYVAAVILLFLFGFTVFEGIMDQIANWERRRNARKTFSLEDGNEKNGKIFFTGRYYDDLKNRRQEYFEDLNENYVPMWNRYKRLCNLCVFYYIVGSLIILMIATSTVIEMFFYNTKQDPQRTFIGIVQLLYLLVTPFSYYSSIRDEIEKDNEIQF